MDMSGRLIFKTGKSGFTLAELLMSLLIVFILIFAFTPLIVFSFNNIYKAGEDRAKLLEDKSNVEIMISDGTSDTREEIPVGLIDSSGNPIPGTNRIYQIGMESSGELKTAVSDALAASISISPSHVTKGYRNKKIYIYGENIQFQRTPNQFSLVMRSGSVDSVITTVGFNILSGDTIAEFSLPEGLTPENKYFIKYGNMEAQLFIDPQRLIAVGEGGKYYEADDEDNWSSEKTLSGAGRLNEIIYDGVRFIAVDSGGRIFETRTSGDFGWQSASGPSGVTLLNDVLFSNDTYYIAGRVNNGARIYEKQSWNGAWTDTMTDNMTSYGSNYKALSQPKTILLGRNNSSNRMYCLDSNNEIKYYVSSSNQDIWTLENFKIYDNSGFLRSDFSSKKTYDYGNINDIALYESSGSQSTFKCCTSDGYILKYSSGNWIYDGGYDNGIAIYLLFYGEFHYYREKPSNAPEQLNSICYGNNTWVAVGKGTHAMVCKITVDSSGNETEQKWRAVALPSATQDTMLNKVIFYDGKFYAVGNQAVIYSSADGQNWVLEKAPTSTGANLYGIAGR